MYTTFDLEAERKHVDNFGTFVALHQVGEYAIFEYKDKDHKHTMFHVAGTNSSVHSLDSALLLAIGANHMDISDAWRFEKFASRMLGQP